MRRLRFDADTTASATVPGQMAAREEARIAERAALLAARGNSDDEINQVANSRRNRPFASMEDDSDESNVSKKSTASSKTGNKRGHEDVDEDNVAPMAQSSGIEELRERLRARIEAMRIAREGQGKRKARMEERQKKKGKDGKEGNNKDKKAKTPAKNAEDKADAKKQSSVPTEKNSGAKNSVKNISTESAKKSSDDQVLDLAFGALSTQLPGTLAASTITTDKPAHLRALTEGGKKKESMKQLLVKAKKYQRALQDLDASGNHEARLQMEFDNALKRSEGQKVFDDPTLINKSLKRAAKKKEKSAQTWEKRKSDLESENTAKALQKKENRDNKKTRAVKRSERTEPKQHTKSKDDSASAPHASGKAAPKSNNLARPGFEGRKTKPI